MNVLKRTIALILTRTLLLLTACAPVTPPPTSCDGNHTDDDGNEVGTSVGTSGRLFEYPTILAAELIVGGDISSIGGVESGFIGDIAAYNLYSRALTAEEIAELYSGYQACFD